MPGTFREHRAQTCEAEHPIWLNAEDVAQTKGQSGQVVTAANFREDVNAKGSINAGDVALVKSKSGTFIAAVRTAVGTHRQCS